MNRALGLAGGLIAGLTLACPAPLGGWDVAALLREEASVSDLGSQRLGDMIPFPALASDADGERVRLIACRWPSHEPIRVRLQLAGERIEWARRAVASVSQGLPGVELEIAWDPVSAIGSEAGVGSDPGVQIEIVEVASVRDSGPAEAGTGCQPESAPHVLGQLS